VVGNETSSVELVQNPAFGSIVLWRFGRGYQKEKIGDLPQLLSFFLVLPLILHGPTLREIRSTNLPSGLTKLASKIAEQRERLLAVHDRAVALRDLTLQSIGMGITTNLFHVDYDSAFVRSNEAKMPAPPERLKFHMSGAEKLGRWFARLPEGQVFSILQVDP
jgi:ABC-three component (ABC-3C) system Middle Component 3